MLWVNMNLNMDVSIIFITDLNLHCGCMHGTLEDKKLLTSLSEISQLCLQTDSLTKDSVYNFKSENSLPTSQLDSIYTI